MSVYQNAMSEALNDDAEAFCSEFGVQNSNAGAFWPVLEEVFVSIRCHSSAVRGFFIGAHAPGVDSETFRPVTVIQN